LLKEILDKTNSFANKKSKSKDLSLRLFAKTNWVKCDFSAVIPMGLLGTETTFVSVQQT
jgi:hypothetical protein